MPVSDMKTYCKHCECHIPNPRAARGKIIQEFCNATCRTRYHNKQKVKLSDIPDLLAIALERTKP